MLLDSTVNIYLHLFEVKFVYVKAEDILQCSIKKLKKINKKNKKIK